jgi:hypothetical protein
MSAGLSQCFVARSCNCFTQSLLRDNRNVQDFNTS